MANHIAADYLLATANNRLMITFYVDSQAALMAGAQVHDDQVLRGPELCQIS